MDYSKKSALIFGITGQDGSYLAEFLLGLGYEVHGMIRRSSLFNTARIEHLYKAPQDSSRRLFLHYGDLLDASRIMGLLAEIQPDEVYNLGSQSHVQVSFSEPVNTSEITGLATVKILEAIRLVSPLSRFVQASSSEMYGSTPAPQSEESSFSPRSPYAAAKLFSYWTTINYREAHKMFAANAIMFNHESPRRGPTFVTRKITKAVARIVAGDQTKLFLGNLSAIRDFGYAPEYVQGLWSILQHEEPDDFILATGQSVTVESFLGFAFGFMNLDWREFVEIDPQYLRLTEVDELRGDAAKAKRILGWEAKTLASDLAELMVEEEMRAMSIEGSSYIDEPKWLSRS